MKKLFLALFVMTSSVAFCQTTTDEYNYLTKGYATQIAQGMDMKAGYSITDKGTTPIDMGYTVNVDTKYLYRTSGNVFAGALLIVSGLKGTAKGSTQPSQFICVPAPGSDMSLWNSALTNINTICGNDKDGYKAIMWALMHLINGN